RVEGGAEARELVPPAGVRHALPRIAGLRDALGRAGQAAHRNQSRSRDEGARRGTSGDASSDNQQENEAETIEGAVDVCERAHELQREAVTVARMACID